MTAYVVTVPLVQVATEPQGVAVQVTKGGPVPANITEKALDNLIELGYVEKAPASKAAADAGEPDGPPAKSASKGDWEAYARSQGAADEDLDGKSKADLIDAYGADQD